MQEREKKKAVKEKKRKKKGEEEEKENKQQELGHATEIDNVRTDMMNDTLISTTIKDS